MTAYTIKNLMDVEDSAAQRSEDVEARFARRYLDSEHLGISYFRYAPGFHSPSGHSHREQEEAYIVIDGGGRIKLDDEIVALKRWDVVRVSFDHLLVSRRRNISVDARFSFIVTHGPSP